MRRSSNDKNWIADENWIAAKASEKVDDQSVWNCTLFRMDLTEDKKKASFYHVQSGKTVCIPNSDWSRKMFLCIDHPTGTTKAISTIFDYDKFVVLPKLVAFKGQNDLFYTNAYNKAARFDSNDIGDLNIVCEILTTRDGHIQIKAQRTNRFWKRISKEWSNNWIGADDKLEENNQDQMFEVIKVENNIVALRNLGNNLICRSSELLGVDGVLAALGEGITKEAKLKVIEPVFSRTIKVLEYDIRNAKIYDLTPISNSSTPFDNSSKDLIQDAHFNFKIIKTKSTQWSNSVSVSLGVKTTFETGIPLIVKGRIEVTATASYEHQWQESIEETQEIGTVFSVKVPPLETAVGTMVASKGRCHVDFSYVQIDHLTNGDTIKTTMHDGVFTGVNYYNIRNSVNYETYIPPALPA